MVPALVVVGGTCPQQQNVTNDECNSAQFTSSIAITAIQQTIPIQQQTKQRKEKEQLSTTLPF